MMCLLVEVAPHMRQLYPSMPVRVLQAICYAIAIFMTDEGDQQASWVDKVRVPFSNLSFQEFQFPVLYPKRSTF